MKKDQGFGSISTIITLALAAVIGWYIYSNLSNSRTGESPTDAIDRAKTNVDKANDASNKVKDAVDSFDSN